MDHQFYEGTLDDCPHCGAGVSTAPVNSHEGTVTAYPCQHVLTLDEVREYKKLKLEISQLSKRSSSGDKIATALRRESLKNLQASISKRLAE